MTGRSFLRRLADRIRLHGLWLVREVPKAPGLELYARAQDLFYRHEAARLAALRTPDRDPTLEPFHPRPIPRIVWTYWGQGAAQMPRLVRLCVESWQRHNPGWTVRLLDARDLARVGDLGHLPPWVLHRYGSNLLRLHLLAAEGGVWVDATVYCHRPLDDWLPLLAMPGWFAFDHDGPSRRVASWFLAAVPGHPVVTGWRDAYQTYLRRLTCRPDKYFMFSYVGQWRRLCRPAERAAFRHKAGLPAGMAFLMMSALEGRTPVAVVRKAVAAGLPVSKLSHKVNVPDPVLDRLVGQIEAAETRQAAPAG